MPYLMTKGTVSLIRQDEAGVKEAEAAGYQYVGKCDQDGKIVQTFEPEQPAKKAKKAE